MTTRTPVANKIRVLAEIGQYGHSRTPRNFYIDESFTSFYWNNRLLSGGSRLFENHAEWVRGAKLLKRYHRFVDYCENIAPQWKQVSTIQWGDNSIDVVEQSKDGYHRTRQIEAPHGDRCV